MKDRCRKRLKGEPCGSPFFCYIEASRAGSGQAISSPLLPLVKSILSDVFDAGSYYPFGVFFSHWPFTISSALGFVTLPDVVFSLS